MRLLLAKAGYSPEQIEEQLLERKHMSIGQPEKTYPASIIHKALQHSGRDGRENPNELVRVMEILEGLKPWQSLIHASEISSIHLNKQVKIIGSKQGLLTDYNDQRGGPSDTIFLVIDGKFVRARGWDDVIVYMSEE